MEINPLVIKYCKCCKYRQSTLDSRNFLCSLTNKPPDFEETCSTYWEDPKLVKEQKINDRIMKDAIKGRKRFLYFSGVFVGINVLAIIFGMLTYYNYQNLGHIKAIIRLVLELIILFGIYNGNSLTKHVFTALLAIGVILWLISIQALLQYTLTALALIPLCLFYMYAICFINMDKYFLAFFKSQKL